MIKRILPMLFVLGVFYSVSSVPAQAQTTCKSSFYCYWYGFNTGCVPTPPPGATFAEQVWLWESRYTYANANPGCFPPNGPNEICQQCNAIGGSPIDLLTGNTFIDQTDVKVPGLGGGLTLARTWNSKWPATQSLYQIGLFGPNWRSTYEERILIGVDGYVKYSRSDGSFWSFGYAGAAYSPVAPANVIATLTYDLSNWTLTFQNGEKRLFSSISGKLTSIVDRNGNTTTLSYDSYFRLTTVADPGGRHLYFGYGSGSTQYLVTGVTSDIGISLSYAYDSQGRLIQVTNPDSTVTSFQYDSNSMITAVKDNSGNVLESHTYDSQGRGLTSSRDSGVEAITVTY
jgi:YD repeat-containing protein